MTPGWHLEIDELHAFFEAYFLGHENSLERAESVLADDFAIVGPDGVEVDRAGTIAMLKAGHARAESITITTSEHQLLFESDELVVASYVEHHQLAERQNERLSTVCFVPAAMAPNGVRWFRVHETWRSAAR